MNCKDVVNNLEAYFSEMLPEEERKAMEDHFASCPDCHRKLEESNQLEEFIAQKAEWPADKDAKIVVYCGSGHRSTIAMTMLYSYGYTDVGSLKDGFGGWATEGYPVIEYVAP